MNSSSPELPADDGIQVSWREAFLTWSRVALLSFGGPAGQIAVMHRIIVEEKKWLSEQRFLHALNFCMLLPGPEAQQLATYIGWLMLGPRGGLLAGGLFILPGLVSIMALSLCYVCFQQVFLIQGLFLGLKPAVMAIVIEAVLRIGKRVLKNRTMTAISLLSFIALFFFHVPFPVLILTAGVAGYVGGWIAPKTFVTLKGHGSSTVEKPGEHLQPRIRLVEIQPSWRHAFVVSAIALPLWFGPLILVWQILGSESVLLHEGVFFSKAAVVTFGGAYSVLAYVAQQAVDRYEWLRPGEMLDGLGMAETTPGPLIMVVQFVAFMGAYRHPEPFSPITAAILGSLLTTWVTFVPCFYWIFLGGPWVDRLRTNERLSASLSTITAAVVGVVLNLAVWFAIQTLFATVDEQHYGLLKLLVPDLSSLKSASMLIAGVAMLLTFALKQPMHVTLITCGILGIVLRGMFG